MRCTLKSEARKKKGQIGRVLESAGRKALFFASSSARCILEKQSKVLVCQVKYHNSFDALINHAINHKTCRPLQSQFLIKVRSTINQNCFCKMSHFSAGLFVLIQTAFQIFDLRLDDDGFFSKQYIFFLITS